MLSWIASKGISSSKAKSSAFNQSYDFVVSWNDISSGNGEDGNSINFS